MIIEITSEEAESLKVLIEERVRRFGPEIHHTDNRDYRAMLGRMRDKLEDVLAKLDQEQACACDCGAPKGAL